MLIVAFVESLRTAGCHLVALLLRLFPLNISAIMHSLGGISEEEHRGETSVFRQGLLLLLFLPCVYELTEKLSTKNYLTK